MTDKRNGRLFNTKNLLKFYQEKTNLSIKRLERSIFGAISYQLLSGAGTVSVEIDMG